MKIVRIKRKRKGKIRERDKKGKVGIRKRKI